MILWVRPEIFQGEFLGIDYYVSTVGRDCQVIREYIKNQEREDVSLDQQRLI